MYRSFLLAAAVLTLSLASNALALEDDIATVGLYHMESIYYDDAGYPYTADDDIWNAGRNHNLILWRSGLNETAPNIVPGYAGNALEFTGEQFANCSTFWSSSYTEVKVDFMLYLYALPTELGAAATYVIEKNKSTGVFDMAIWPSTGGDYLRARVMSAGSTVTASGEIVVQNLKDRWLHVVFSYDASKNFLYTITDTTTDTVYSVTATGTAALYASDCDFTVGSTSPSLGSKPTNRNLRGMVDEMKISNKVSPSHISYTPAPATAGTVYARPDVLSWSKGLVALGSDVFFGTSSTTVAAATKPAVDINGDHYVDFFDFAALAAQWQAAPQYPSADINKSGLVNGADLYQLVNTWLTSTSSLSPLYLAGTTGNTVTCPSLVASKTYYWRVDSVNNSENIAGTVWSFTTGSSAASSPTPSTAATGVATDSNSVTLKWVAGFNASSYNIYFGTTSSPSFLSTSATASFHKSGLRPGTKYYWRIDSVAPSGTTTGTVWNFTTGSIGATTPSPAAAATDVTFPLAGIDLTWTSVFKPASYNVYFGTQASPPYVGSTTTPNFRSPNVVQNTTYYWRIDCVSVFGTVTGTVWSFTTSVPAFPQAEGFGRFAKGGRGGTVYHVTNLNDTGTGSFRDAISAGSRTIVFDVGGQIICATRLSISASNITIAGQTAPGQGISIAGPGIGISGDHIIMRYLRFRQIPPSSDPQDDCVSVNSTCQNVILDHISASWATDEVLSVGGIGAANITVQWSMVTEGSNALGHSKGSLLEMPVLSWHHNIYAHNSDRNPKNKGTFDYRNNVVWNWGVAPYIAGGGTGAQCYANCVGNYYIAGPNSVNPNYMVVGGNSNYHLYMSDNRLDYNRNGVLDGVDLGTDMVDPSAMPVLMSTPYEFPPVATTSPEVAYTQVLANAGCSLSRDSIDTRVIDDIVNQTGWIISIWSERGGLGTITGGTAPLDTDQDGMPDAWEDAHGLSKTNAADGATVGADGYTNLENYLNSLAVYP